MDDRIARKDLHASLKAKLVEAHRRLWSTLDVADAVLTCELWSWSFRERPPPREPCELSRWQQRTTRRAKSAASQELNSSVSTSFRVSAG